MRAPCVINGANVTADTPSAETVVKSANESRAKTLGPARLSSNSISLRSTNEYSRGPPSCNLADWRLKGRRRLRENCTAMAFPAHKEMRFLLDYGSFPRDDFITPTDG